MKVGMGRMGIPVLHLSCTGTENVVAVQFYNLKLIGRDVHNQQVRQKSSKFADRVCRTR